MRLAWEEIQLPAFPRYRYVTNVSNSSRGTLLRYLEHPDSITSGILMTRDGGSWTQASAPLEEAPLGFPVEGGRDWLQVAEPLGDGAPLELLASVDGVTWTVRGRLPAEVGRAMLAAVSGAAIVVCGGARSADRWACVVSGDEGATWDPVQELDALLQARVLYLTSTPKGFVLMRKSLLGHAAAVTTATSPDGRTWTTLPDAAVPGLSPEIGWRLGAQGGSLVISGAVRDGEEFIRAIWTSADGQAWERVPLPRIVAWSGELMTLGDAAISLAVDGRGDSTRLVGLLVSGDGTTWRSDTVPADLASTFDWEWSFQALNGALLAFQQGTGPADVTPRALLGRPVPAADPGPSPAPAPTTLPEPSGTVPPAVSWTVGATHAGARVTDVVSWRNGYLAVGYAVGADGLGSIGPAAWTSPDGLAWTQTLDPSTFPGSPDRGAPRMLRAVVKDWVIVVAGDAPGERDDDVSTPVAAFWRSTDAMTWERVPHRAEFVIGMPRLEEGPLPGLGDLTVGGPGFVAMGTTRADGAVAWTSIDGWDWRRSTTLGDGYAGNVVAGEAGLVALGGTGGPEDVGRFWTSPDGLEWSAADWPSNLHAGRMAVFGSLILTAGFPPSRSSDGLSWESAPPQAAFERADNEDGLTGIAGAAWGYVGVGRYLCPDSLRPCPAAWTSADGVRWDRMMLPLADREWAACPSCQVTPVAAVVAGRRIIVVGATYDPGAEAPGWASWVGTVATP